MDFTLLLLGCFLLRDGLVTALWTELDLQSITIMNVTGSRPIILDLSAKRVRRGVIGISGVVTYNDDLHKYTCGADIFFSPNGNAAFTRSPINVQPGPLCDKFNNEYRKYLMEQMGKASELPQATTGDMCEIIEQREYKVNNYIIESGQIPKFLQRGVYRVEITMRDEAGVVTSGITAVLKLS